MEERWLSCCAQVEPGAGMRDAGSVESISCRSVLKPPIEHVIVRQSAAVIPRQ